MLNTGVMPLPPARGLPKPAVARPAARWQVAPPVQNVVVTDDSNSARKFAFYSGLGMMFIMFGTVPEVLAYVLHANTYLLYVFGPPALLGAAFAGGIGRTFRNKAAKYFLIFFALMIMAAPFSSWQGASFWRVMDYARFSFPLLIVAGGMATRWNEIRAIFYTVACAAFVNLIATRLFTSDDQGRLSLDASGTIGNPNDLAAHLLLVLPFILFIVMDPRRNAFIRYILLAPIVYGIWVILGTASRGGLIGLGVVVLFMFWRASMTVRVQVAVVSLVLAFTLPALLPHQTVARLGSLFGEHHEEADESEASRSYLFRMSVIYTLEHPIFGVGPDQFGNYEGKMMTSKGERGEWHATHCAFTQVSSECGIPALIFFLLGIGSSMVTVNRVWKRARQGGYKEICAACYCYMAAMAGFLTAITFLADAYRFYLPAMIGFAIAMSAAAERYMRENPQANAAPQGLVAVS